LQPPVLGSKDAIALPLLGKTSFSFCLLEGPQKVVKNLPTNLLPNIIYLLHRLHAD